MNQKTQNIIYSTPNKKNISKEQYLKQIKKIIYTAFQEDPTIILHIDEEILEKYATSIVASDENNIIGNINIYPTRMKPLDNIYCPINGRIQIGEL